MANFISIDRLDRPELDVYARLTENQLRNRLEPEKGIFIAQTPKVIRCALEAGCVPLSFLAEEAEPDEATRRLLEMAGTRDLPVYTAPRTLLEQLTGYALTRGLLCAMHRPVLPTLAELCTGARRIAVLDGVVDATNVGAIMRSAAALDIDAVVVTSACCDPLNRRAVRVSMGTVFQVPWTLVPSDPKAPVQPWMTELKELGFATVAMALRCDTVDLDDPILMAQPRLAILLGSEGWGLPPEIIRSCDYTVRIPMRAGVDSLNVAAASAVAFWQLRRRD